MKKGRGPGLCVLQRLRTRVFSGTVLHLLVIVTLVVAPTLLYTETWLRNSMSLFEGSILWSVPVRRVPLIGNASSYGSGHDSRPGEDRVTYKEESPGDV